MAKKKKTNGNGKYQLVQIDKNLIKELKANEEIPPIHRRYNKDVVEFVLKQYLGIAN